MSTRTPARLSRGSPATLSGIVGSGGMVDMGCPLQMGRDSGLRCRLYPDSVRMLTMGQQFKTYAKINEVLKDPKVLDALNENDKKSLLEWLAHAKYNWELNAGVKQRMPEGKWTTWLLLAGRAFGKLLGLETPILTGDRGFVPLSEIRVGDRVIDEAGRPTTVLATFDDTPEVAYRLTFSDGTHIDACSEHQWVTWTHAERKAYNRSAYESAPLPEDWPNWVPRRRSTRPTDPRGGPGVRTTQDIVDTFRYGKRDNLNHSIPTAATVELPEVGIPLDPYIFGYWIGDGSRSSPTITVHPDDIPNLGAALDRAGIEWSRYPSSDNTIGLRGILPALRATGALGTKEIPDYYLMNSEPNRLALLRGLMDSDGYCAKSGASVEFCSMTRVHAEAVLWLARSFGEKPRLGTGRAMLDGVYHGEKYRVTWNPVKVNPFLLPRKAGLVKAAGSQQSRNYHRMIVDFERIDPAPMRCLTVDSPNSLFLAGESLIPTHNTRVGAETVRHLVNDHGYRSVGLIAPTAADARDTMIDGKGGSSLLEITPEDEGLHYYPTKRRIVWDNGAVGSSFSAEEPERLRGPQNDLLWSEEMCLVGETLVLAEHGEVAIRDLGVGDRVWTRVGLRRVVNHAMTSPGAEVFEITAEDGRTLCGTVGHPLHVIDEGFRMLGDTRGAILTSCQNIRTLHGTTKSGTFGVTTTRTAKDISSTGQNMSTPMGVFQRVTMFTISMATRLTTMLRTLWRSPFRITSSFTHGLGVQRLALGRPSDNGEKRSQERSFAPGVAKGTSQLGLGQSSVIQIANRPILDTAGSRVLDVRRLPGRRPVYNIEVEGEHEYFANGFLTHNCAWRYLQETWDMAQFGFRLGQNPRHIITTTPKPIQLIRDLSENAVPAEDMKPGMVEDVVITRGTTMDNRHNLAPNFIETLMAKYEGTRLGRQEVYAEILEDNPNSLFSQANIDQARVEWNSGMMKTDHEVSFTYVLARGSDGPNNFKVVFREIIVAVDPAMTADIESDETGIVVMARDDRNHIYVLEDATGIHTPNEWARIVIGLYLKYKATNIVAEVNQGGDLVENTIRTVEKEMGVGRVEYTKVRASKGKIARAEPVGALTEQHRIHHVGDFPKLEDQLVGFSPGYARSPDRVDAYVWGAHHLVVQKENRGFFIG